MTMAFGELSVEARFRELREPERIVFDLVRRANGSGESPATRVTVALAERAGATEVELRHEGVADDELPAVRHAWQQSLGRLAGECPAGLERYYSRLERWPRFRSRFGGLWPDLSDAPARIAGKGALGALSPADAALFRHWVEHGWVVLERAVAAELVGRLRDELERAYETGDERVALEVFDGGELRFPRLAPRYRDRPHKVLDYHAHSAAARDAQFAPAIRRFLGQLFERPPLAFQSLVFRWGSEQAMHQDSAYVVVRSPMEFVGCWIAAPDSERLEHAPRCFYSRSPRPPG